MTKRNYGCQLDFIISGINTNSVHQCQYYNMDIFINTMLYKLKQIIKSSCKDLKRLNSSYLMLLSVIYSFILSDKNKTVSATTEAYRCIVY